MLSPLARHLPSSSPTVRLEVFESHDEPNSKPRLIHRGGQEAAASGTPLQQIRLVLLPDSSQRLTFSVFDASEKSLGHIELGLRELLSESTQKGVNLNPVAGSSSSPSAAAAAVAGVTLALQVATGVGAVLSSNKDGVRQVAGRDHSNRSAHGTPRAGVASISTAAFNAPHHADIKFADQPTFNPNKTAKGETLELEVATTSIPALDAISVPAPLVSIHDKQGLMLAHTDVGSHGNSRFARRLIVPVASAPYNLRVYDATEESLNDSHLIGTISGSLPLEILKNLAQTSGGVSLPLTSSVAGIEKRLRKKDATIQILSVSQKFNDAVSPRAAESKPYNHDEHIAELNAGELVFVDANGVEHRSAALSSPKADATVVTLVVSAIGLPKLDALKPAVGAVAALWKKDSSSNAWTLVGHTEIVSHSNPTFTTPLNITLGATNSNEEYKIEVYDASEDRITPSSLLGVAPLSSSTVRALGQEEEIDIVLRNEGSQEVQKKLEKKYTSLQLSRSGAHSATLARRQAARQARIDNKGKPLPPSEFPAPSPSNAATTAHAASHALPEEVPTPTAASLAAVTLVAAAAASAGPAMGLSSMKDIGEGDESEEQGPKSPQHQAEETAASEEAQAVQEELSAQQRFAAAEANWKALSSGPQPKRGDSKATQAHKKAQEEMEAARIARDAAQARANAARANLAAKRAARIAEEDRLKAEALALRMADPNYTIFGLRKPISRQSSLAQSRDFGASQIDQIAAARRLAGVSGATEADGKRGPSQLFLLRTSVSGVKGAGAWKPALGVYELPSQSANGDGSYVDHTEKLDAISAEGAAKWAKPMLIERFINETQVLRFNLYNMSGDKALPDDLIASGNVPFSAISDLKAGQELSLPLYHASNKLLNDRLTRQSAAIRIQVALRGQGNSGSVIDANPTVPATIQGGGDASAGRGFAVVDAEDPSQGEKEDLTESAIDESAEFEVGVSENVPTTTAAAGEPEAFLADSSVVVEKTQLADEEAKSSDAPAVAPVAVSEPAVASSGEVADEPAASPAGSEGGDATPAADGASTPAAGGAAGGKKKKAKGKGKGK
jgi:hypothetical protein